MIVTHIHRKPPLDSYVKIIPDETQPHEFFEITVSPDGTTYLMCRPMDSFHNLEVKRIDHRKVLIGIQPKPYMSSRP